MRDMILEAHCNHNIGDDIETMLPSLSLSGVSLPDGRDLPDHRAVLANGNPIAVISRKYTLVEHRDVFRSIRQAVAGLDVGQTRHGIYHTRDFRRVRALYKFPDLAEQMPDGKSLCPVVRVTNSVDASTRIRIEIGAFRFVCTNFAIGGGGVFTGGFAAIHRGTIDIERAAQQIRGTLGNFGRLAEIMRQWHEQPVPAITAKEISDQWGERHAHHIVPPLTTVSNKYAAYNMLTQYGSHKMRSAERAFEFLAWTNQKFQEVANN